MVETIGGIAGIVLLAMVIEAIIAYVLPKNETDEPREWIKYLSAGLGIVLCVAYRADILAMLGVISPLPYVGSVVTGLIIGRGSNFLNDFYQRIKNPMPQVVIEEKETDSALG